MKWNQRVEELLAKMTLHEKIGQACQRGTSSMAKELPENLVAAVRAGRVGSAINIMDRDLKDELQRIAVEESPNGIPLLFGRDVVHGYKTIFPIPLGQAATWNPAIVKEGSRIAAAEATTNGIKWTFAPMIDISRDPRWGRIAESAGEDTHLTSVMSVAYVEGFQGDDLANPASLVACVKHFAAYGAVEGGRDYNTSSVPEHLLREIFLPPFKAALDAGVATVMSSFNDINGVPATGNRWLLTDVLRKEWGFTGFVVSDWNSVIEMIEHGYCADAREAAIKAVHAGLDMEMTSTAYEEHLASLIAAGIITEAQLDIMVRNILIIKYKAGLFKNPYTDRTRDHVVLCESHLAAAKEAATQSMVLLKNEGRILPLAPTAKIALIGPLADAPHEQLGTWIFDGSKENSVTPRRALKETYGEYMLFAQGLTHSRDRSEDGFAAAISHARNSDVIIFVGGEESILSGEAHSRADISLPGAQEQLILELSKTGKPIVLVIFAGRPISIERVKDQLAAIVMGWHPGTMAGPALADLLTGKSNFSGRLPVTWPKTSGQVPVYYNHPNTGRPADAKSYVPFDEVPIGAWQSSLGNTSHYMDLGFTPQYPFGYGLSYTSFEYSDLRLSSSTLGKGGSIEVSATVRNAGIRDGVEVVQLYIRDLVADRARPVRELKGFERIELQAGAAKTVTFSITTSDLSYYNQEMNLVTDPGDFHVWMASNAESGLMGRFTVK